MNLYDASVPVFITMLENLAGILAKAEVWATENGKSDEDVLQARLAPDMFSLVKQVQIASDNAKSISARLAGEEPPKMEDIEATFAELIERTRKTVVYLQTLNREKFEGAEDRHIPFPYVPDTYLLGHEALLRSYLPNFFFHVTTAYAILRNQGVLLGKADFIGALPLKPNAQ
ncbi:MAG: DUF1993 domain-containing protein [Candidatus Moraniibacteriota bacterium]|nr:MAG: DUF1993 domain-containing protein [Candidatus Moranbacteria bacterium]